MKTSKSSLLLKKVFKAYELFELSPLYQNSLIGFTENKA